MLCKLNVHFEQKYNKKSTFQSQEPVIELVFS